MKKLFDNKEYAIYHLEDNGEDIEQFKILIKELCRPKPNYSSAQIGREVYSSIDNGIIGAHETAKEHIAQFFTSEPLPENQFKRITRAE